MNELIRISQISISPLTLISGVGLLLLSMTNRFARTTDRARARAREARTETEVERESLKSEIRILYRRSPILLVSISLALRSIFMLSVLIISLFASSIFIFDLHVPAGALFALSLAALIGSLALFSHDMTLALHALELELKENL